MNFITQIMGLPNLLSAVNLILIRKYMYKIRINQRYVSGKHKTR